MNMRSETARDALRKAIMLKQQQLRLIVANIHRLWGSEHPSWRPSNCGLNTFESSVRQPQTQTSSQLKRESLSRLEPELCGVIGADHVVSTPVRDVENYVHPRGPRKEPEELRTSCAESLSLYNDSNKDHVGHVTHLSEMGTTAGNKQNMTVCRDDEVFPFGNMDGSGSVIVGPGSYVVLQFTGTSTSLVGGGLASELRRMGRCIITRGGVSAIYRTMTNNDKILEKINHADRKYNVKMGEREKIWVKHKRYHASILLHQHQHQHQHQQQAHDEENQITTKKILSPKEARSVEIPRHAQFWAQQELKLALQPKGNHNLLRFHGSSGDLVQGTCRNDRIHLLAKDPRPIGKAQGRRSRLRWSHSAYNETNSDNVEASEDAPVDWGDDGVAVRIRSIEEENQKDKFWNDADQGVCSAGAGAAMEGTATTTTEKA